VFYPTDIKEGYFNKLIDYVIAVYSWFINCNKINETIRTPKINETIRTPKTNTLQIHIAINTLHTHHQPTHLSLPLCTTSILSAPPYTSAHSHPLPHWTPLPPRTLHSLPVNKQ